MATLGAPRTVIGDGTSGDGRPPLATWYDQSNGLFIGLLNDGSCNKSSPKSHPESASSVNVMFQTYSVPTGNHGTDPAVSSRRELIQREEPIIIELPVDVVGQTSFTPGQDEGDESPMMLAKLSLDQRYLAIQFSNTNLRIIRIAKIGDGDLVGRDNGIRIPGEYSIHSTSDGDPAATAFSKFRKQWTIDLTASSGEEPLVSDPGAVPKLDLFAGGAGAVARAAGFHARRFLNRRSTDSSNEMDSVTASFTDEILPGGILWVDRREDGHPILILVTSRSVLLYKISPEKHSMKRFASYSVPTAIQNFWYEPRARCLMVGSLCRLFEDGENIETFDMSAWSFGRQLRGGTSSDESRRKSDTYSETTTFERFTVGKKVDGPFLLESISLVSLYNTVFCLAIGEKSATYIKLDTSTGRVSQLTDVPYPNQTGQFELDVTRAIISVVDNAVIIVDRSSLPCLLLDVNEPSNRPFAAWISSDGFDTCNEETSSFLPPSSLLDSSGRGRLHDISLNLQSIFKSVAPTAGVVSFLLRRRGEYERVGLRLAIDAISRVIDDKSNASSSLLPTFIDVLSVHKDCNLMDRFDSAACLPLVHQAALLSSNEATAPVSIEHGSADGTTFSFLSQSDMLHKILIPQAKKSIAQNDAAQLNRLCEFSLLYLQRLEQRKLVRTPALECYACALLWRLSNGEEIVSMLRARYQWRQAHSHHSPSFKEDVLGQEALAEMLIAIVTDPICNYGGRDGDRISKLIIAYAIDLLNNIRSFQVAGKHLLVLGRCGDAIAVTQKAISQKSRTQQEQQIVPIKGAVAFDFFCAAVNEAQTLEGVGDRCRLFFNVHSFISDYDPDCMVMAPCDSGELQSALASKFGNFPSELFGGDDDSSAISLRAMFGFSIAHAREK